VVWGGMKKTIKLLILFLLVSSCASQKKLEIEVEKEIQQATVVTRSDVTKNAREYILNSKTLSEQQKQNLIMLQDKTEAETKIMIEEKNRTQLVLVKTILEPTVNEKEVYILRKKIKKLDKQRMDLDEKSFTEARKIIDPLKEIRDREFLYNSFIWRHHYW
jgi:hypothetical protein